MKLLDYVFLKLGMLYSMIFMSAAVLLVLGTSCGFSIMFSLIGIFFSVAMSMYCFIMMVLVSNKQPIKEPQQKCVPRKVIDIDAMCKEAAKHPYIIKFKEVEKENKLLIIYKAIKKHIKKLFQKKQRKTVLKFA